jgi:hypothetical protein
MLEGLGDKIGTIIAALVTTLGGYMMYNKKMSDDRFGKLESSSTQNTIDLKIIEVRFNELKEDTQEIKESQRAIIDLLTKR